MQIVDAHHHLWDTRRLHYTLFDQIPALNRPFPIKDYDRVAALNGVEASVCVEAASAGTDGMAELAWLRQQGDRSAHLKAIVAWAPVERPELPAYLEKLSLPLAGSTRSHNAYSEGPPEAFREKAGEGVSHARIVGVRRSFEFEPPDFAARPETVEGVRRLAEFGLSFDLVLFHPSLPAAVELVRQCPEVSFILDHLGKPNIRESRLEPWSSHLAELAALPNVVCKVSGMTTEADREAWTVQDLRPYFDRAVDCFGWDRLMFGSDWPVCNLAGGFQPWLEAANTLLAGVPATDRAKFFVRNAARVYRLH